MRSGAVSQKTQAPSPPAGAKTDTDAGEGPTAIGTANQDLDSDSAWVEEIDFDGDAHSCKPIGRRQKVEYQRQAASLRHRFPSYGPYHSSVALGIAAVVSGLGILGFVLVVLQQ